MAPKRKQEEPAPPPPAKKGNTWLDHVAEYRKQHPEKSYKEALQCAKCTYKS